MTSKVSLLFLFIFSTTTCLIGQSQRMYKYVVFFADKDTLVHQPSKPGTFLSAKAIARKQERNIPVNLTDVPVSASYLNAIAKDTGFIIRNTSRWFNSAVVFTLKKDAAKQLAQVHGVKQVLDVGYSSVRSSRSSTVDLDAMINALEQKFVRRNRKESDTNIYGAGLNQAALINVPALHTMGMNGSTTTVAVIDAGFSKANTHKAFSHTLKNVIATYDFVDMEQNVFNDDDHGTAVWSCIGASDSFNFIGTAPCAKYVLLRSEDAPTEFPVEEFYWATAAEFADSMGVDIISSSLGYNEFGDAKYNYSHKNLDGKTAWISKAATLASQKGMLVINSCGNEGDNNWKQVTFPADAEAVISVGSVDKSGHLSDFSSIGLTADKRIKPNLVAMGEGNAIASELGNVHTGNGTSYSCPVLAGGIACLWPELKKYSDSEIKNILQLSSSAYSDPDKYLGYGIPDLQLAYKLAQIHTIDTLLDARLLNDKNIHVAIFLAQKQKVKFILTSADGLVVHNQTEQLKQAGNNRIRLDKIKLAAGVYTLTVQFANTEYKTTLEL